MIPFCKSSYQLPLIAFVTIFLWASAFVGIRYGLHDYHPGSMALLRYGVASICMAVVYFYTPNKIPTQKRDIPIIILCGILGIGLYNITLNYGEITTPAAIASFTISQAPVVSTILAIIFLGERPKLVALIGIVVSFAGVLLIAYSSDHHANAETSHTALMLIVLAVFCSSLYGVLQKPLLNRIQPVQFVCYAIWAGTAVLLIYASQLWQDLQTASWQTTLTVVYMGIFPAAIAYFLWSYLLSKASVTKVAAILYLIPLMTMLLGWLCLDEIPKALAIVGGLIALLGAYLVNRK